MDSYQVVAAFDDAASSSDGANLKEWVRQYPEYADALIHHAMYRRIVQASEERGAPECEVDFLGIARRVAHQMRFDNAGQPLEGLLAAAKGQGITPPQLAQQAGLSPPLLAKLENRLVDASTVPRAVAQRLAVALGRTLDEIAAYLRQPARLAPGAAYKANQAPRLASAVRESGEPYVAREPFLSALEAAPGLAPEQKARLREEAAEPLGE